MTYKILVPDHNFSKEAELVSVWTNSAGTMLPKTSRELEQFIIDQRSVLIEEEHLGLVAFAAITFFWPDNWAELGAVVVHPENRGRGWGSLVVAALLTLANDKFAKYNFFALCNINSLNLFLRNNGRIITDPNLLPREVWGECIHCPNFQKARGEEKLCCDTPVNMTNAVKVR